MVGTKMVELLRGAGSDGAVVQLRLPYFET